MIESEVFKALFTHAHEGILIVVEGRITRVNNSACKLFGYRPGCLEGKPLDFLIPGYLKKNFFLSSGKSISKSLQLHGKTKHGNEFPLELSLTPFDQDGQNNFIAYIIDITERKKAEEKLRHYSIELEREVKDRTLVLQEAITQLEKTKEELNSALQQEKELNDMKSRFVSMASHEFRTPLATILSSITLISKYHGAEFESRRTKHIERIKSAVNNMTDILNDFLSLGKLEEGKINIDAEEFNLKELAHTSVQEMQGFKKHGQKIMFAYLGNEMIYADKKITRNIFMNLISNAMKFSKDEGVIYIRIKGHENGYCVEVEDNGIGISKEDQRHLFERFFRGKNATNIQGTGLGLNIVAKYVELLEGDIQVKSELDKGTTFIINLPFKQKKTEKIIALHSKAIKTKTL